MAAAAILQSAIVHYALTVKAAIILPSVLMRYLAITDTAMDTVMDTGVVTLRSDMPPLD